MVRTYNQTNASSLGFFDPDHGIPRHQQTPLFKGGKNFPSGSPSKTDSNDLMIVGQSSQHLQPNFLSTQQKMVSSPSPDFSVSPSTSSNSNNSNLPQQTQGITIRNDTVTPNPNEMYQGLSSSLQTKQIRAPSRQSRWKSQQNISRVGNPYPTNNQIPNQFYPNLLPLCQQTMNPNQLVLSNPLVAASCCLHQHQDPFGNIYFVPQKPALDLGLCRGCRKLYATSPMIQNGACLAGVKPALDYGDLLNRKRQEEAQYRNSADPFASVTGTRSPSRMKPSISDGMLSQGNHPTGLHNEQSLASGLQDLTSVLNRLQGSSKELDTSFGMGFESFNPANEQMNILSSPEKNNRKPWSAPNETGHPLSLARNNRGPGPGEGPNYGRAKATQRQQIQNGFEDPLQHLHRTRQNDQYQQSEYSPSVFDVNGARVNSRKIDPAKEEQSTYLKDLEAQIAEQRARKVQEKKDQRSDWWEKKTDPAYSLPSPKKPHPSMTAYQRPDPKDGQQQYEDDLKKQIEMKKVRAAEEKRKQKEEEEKLEKRIQEQQERMKKEYEEEVAKKRAKEEAKQKRQDEMSRKQKELQKEAERKRKEAAERKFQERKAARENAASAEDASKGDPLNATGIFIPERDVERRADSPPIPSMRGKQPSNGNPNFDDSNQDDILTVSDGGTGLTTSDDDQDTATAKQQLNNMKRQLNKKQEEISDVGRRQSEVWEGLAEV